MNIEYLKDSIARFNIIDLPARQVLYRGTFDDERNEYPEMNIITGVKTFAFERAEALRYADPDPGVNPCPGKPNALPGRGVLFTVKLLSPCRVLVFENLSTHYTEAQVYDYRQFEQEVLFPMVREVHGDPFIAGYVTTRNLSDAYEAVIDTSRCYFCSVVAERVAT